MIKALVDGHTVPFSLHEAVIALLLAPAPLPRPATAALMGVNAAPSSSAAPPTSGLQDRILEGVPPARMVLRQMVRGIDWFTLMGEGGESSRSVLLTLSDEDLAAAGASFADVSLDALDVLSPAIARALFPDLPVTAFLTSPAPFTVGARAPSLTESSPYPSDSTFSEPVPPRSAPHSGGGGGDGPGMSNPFDRATSPHHYASPLLDWLPVSWVDAVGAQAVALAAAATPVTRSNVGVYVALAELDHVIISRWPEVSPSYSPSTLLFCSVLFCSVLF